MTEMPDNLTESQRLLRLVDDLAKDVKSARWYLGLLCLIAVAGVVLFALWMFGVVTVEINPAGRSSIFG